MTNTLFVTPGSFEMGPEENHHLALNAAAELDGATFSGTPSATLTDLGSNLDYPDGVLATPTIFESTSILCFIGLLTVGKSYLLSAVCLDTAGETWQMYLTIVCV